MNDIPTPSQVASWYHAQILRIPHGQQNPTKRYLDDDQILELFDGEVMLQEKVDGKLSWRESYRSTEEIVCEMVEDITGKHTVHDHVIKYKNLPLSKRVELDSVWFEKGRGFRVMEPSNKFSQLLYCTMSLINPSVDQILSILWAIGQSESHFGAPGIEGLVIKNYRKQLFGKWVSDKFEDKIRGD